ncbi:hypothetical protein NECID01_2032 [Nematocida sp. AWRm77]|nr:hypothetical protein NECID01_2032 [Nematocida sp. AWRm77]
MLVEVVSIRLRMPGSFWLLRGVPSCTVHVQVGSVESVRVHVTDTFFCRVGLVFETEERGEPVVVLAFRKERLEIPLEHGVSTVPITGRKYRGEVCVRRSEHDYFSLFEMLRVPGSAFVRLSSVASIGGATTTRVVYNGETYTVDQERMETTEYAPILLNEVVSYAHTKARNSALAAKKDKNSSEYKFVRKVRQFRSQPEMFITLFSHVQVIVDRENVLGSLFNIFIDPTLKHQLKNRMMIKFVGELGEDHGALRKEFFDICALHIVQDRRICMEKGLYDLTPSADLECLERKKEASGKGKCLDVEDALFYSFLGFFLGNVVFQQVQIPTRFTKIFYNALLRIDSTEEDITDASIKASIAWVRNNPVDEMEFMLKDGTPVTEKNKNSFIKEMIYEEVYGKRSGYRKMSAAFYSIVSKEISQFTAEEFARLLSGVETVPVKYLKETAIYKKCMAFTPEVVHFWSILEEGTEEFRREVLRFITGSSSIQYLPNHVNENIFIEKVDEPDNLPTAHACFRLLVLYSYPTKEALKAKLELALRETEGFHFV